MKGGKKAKAKAAATEQQHTSPETTGAAQTDDTPEKIIVVQAMTGQNEQGEQQEVGGELNREQLW